MHCIYVSIYVFVLSWSDQHFAGQIKIPYGKEPNFCRLSVSPCRLRSCLRKVNDTASRVVGQAFFNVIGVPCFEFKYEEQCAERHWYGM